MAALHFGDPKRNGFAYRLEGFDSDWIHTDAERAVATYTRLAPGDYLLRARAVTSHGVWSLKDATLAIHVLPPWWRTWPALAAWGLLAALGGTGLWLGARRRAQTRLALLEREAFRRASLTDPLTGLYNRRFIGAHLEHELPKVLRGYDLDDRTAGDLLFFLIDVDRFKTINDRFSHAAGDQVLIDVAHALRTEVRDSDLAIRWGGDEFLVVSRSFNRRYAGLAAERLRRAVGSLTLRVRRRGAALLAVDRLRRVSLPAARPAGAQLGADAGARRSRAPAHKRRRRDGHTGLLAGPDVDAATVLAFLSGGPDAPMPEGIEIRTEDAE
jgi:diguanylate cyclase (GGDEF)-like protein